MLAPHSFLGAKFSSKHTFFIIQYRTAYMTEDTKNGNNYIDIRSILSKFQMCIYDTINNFYA